MQLLQVKFDGSPNRSYTYRWYGDALKVGDRVVVPPSWANADPKFATVSDLTSPYMGEVKDLLGVVTEDVIVGPDGEPVDVGD